MEGFDLKDKNILFSAALREEVPDILDSPEQRCRLITTGVGKASAAYGLTREIMRRKPDIVINIGSAGALRNVETGDIAVCTQFEDRDLKPLAIEGVVSEYSSVISLSIPSIRGGREEYSSRFLCNTGDDFVMQGSGISGEVIDMEAFALAMVCHEENIPYFAVKYITDKIGENDIRSWESKLHDEREALSGYLAKYIL